MGLRVELTRQLHLLACTLACAGEQLNLTLHWLAYVGVGSEVTPGKVFEDSPARSLATGNSKIHVV